jgi:hypothetical protein
MVIAVTLAVFLLIFFFVKKHSGPAHLAMIAGLAVYELFGRDLENILGNISGAPLEIIDRCLYIALILVFPLILYFRSDHGGLSGFWRFAESAIFALLLTALLAEPLAEIFAFDNWSHELANFIVGIEGWVVLIGVIAAYLDILVYHSSYD